MAVCDICSQPAIREKSFLLTTSEVVASPDYWRDQFAKYRGVLERMPNREDRATFLAEQALPLILSPNGWLVCESCAPRFEFNRELALQCAASGGERPDAAPSSWAAASATVFPVVVECIDGVTQAPQPASNRSQNASQKKYYQCPGCGSVLVKKADNLRLVQSGVSVSGGSTCAQCRTRSDASEIYAGAFDFDCEDGVIDAMLRDASNAIPNPAAKTWTYRGTTIYGPASSR